MIRWIVVLAGCWTSSSTPAPAPLPRIERARYELRGMLGGVIELRGDRKLAMEAARDKMRDHCEHHVLVQQGDEIVVRDGKTIAVYRVHYRCE